MHFIDSMERMERAYDDWKNGYLVEGPVCRHGDSDDVIDPTMAPPGKHFMRCFIQYVPA